MNRQLDKKPMPSYSPEAIHLTQRPIFNTDATSIFEGGVVVPPGTKAIDLENEIALPDQAAPTTSGQAPLAPTGVVKSLAVTTGGTGLTDGTPTGLATTASTGSGTGLTVDLTISGGVATAATVNQGGQDYANGDTVNVTGQTGVVLTVSV